MHIHSRSQSAPYRLWTWRWFAPAQPPREHDFLSAKNWNNTRSTNFSLLLSHPRASFIIIIAQCIVSTSNALQSSVIGHAADSAISTGSYHEAALAILIFLGLIIISYLSDATSDGLLHLSASRITHQLRLNLTQFLLRSQPANMAPGKILNTVDEDTTIIGELKMILGFPVGMISYLLSSTVIISLIYWPLALLLLLGGITTAILSTITAGALTRISEERRKAENTAITLATDYAQGIRIIKGLGATNTCEKRFREANDIALELMIKDAKITSITYFIRQLAPALWSAGIMSYAAWLSYKEIISPGQMVTVILLTVPSLTAMGMSLGFLTEFWARGHASTKRIAEFISQITPMSHNEEKETPALTEESIQKGITIWVSDTPERLQAATEFVKTIHSHPNVIAPPHIANVFEGTLEENINPEGIIASKNILKALHAAACEDILIRLGGFKENGQLPTAAIGEAGLNLSGGQRQRVALARCLALDPEILILEEPTTGLDSVTLDRVIYRIAKLRKNKKTIVITTSKNWREVADHIITD